MTGSIISRIGPPGVPFLSLEAEAENWAALAESDELKAYATETMRRLSRADRARVLSEIGGANA